MKSVNGKNDSTRERLILAGVRLFSKYGYDATSTRMIAKEAGTSLSAISFHFTGKESLFTYCLEFIAKKIEGVYDDISRKTAALLERDNISKKEAYECMMDIIDRQISVAFGHQYHSSLILTYWEQINSLHGYHPVSAMIFEKAEKSIALLISAVTEIPYERAMIASRFINGSIISFGEHSLLVQYALGGESEAEREHAMWVREEILNYCDVLVKELLQIPR